MTRMDDSTSFVLQLFAPPETTVKGDLIVGLTNRFLSELILPGCDMQWIWTRRARPNAKLNIGGFSERRWKDATQKTAAGEYGVLDIRAQCKNSPDQWISLGTQFNPTRGTDVRIPGRIGVTC